jgi:4-amino-4-deoxy-L-arabinose transferase-like glycosyltransferase
MTSTGTVVQAPEPSPPTMVAADAPATQPVGSLAHRLWRPKGQPTWARPALALLLLATAVLYLWGLGDSGWANSFYSAAAQAGSVSWKAFFFGSFDAGNSITVDKTPASLWLMSLSVRVFGLSSWSILAPEALAGVATVGVLYATVRRWYGAGAGLLAGAVMALTPVAVLMFRFNNPDALLVLLLVLAAYACVRAIETASTWWLALVGVLVGLGFLTKMLQALLVVPAFALTYLIAAPTGLWRRVRQLLVAGLAMLVGAGWWVAIVELIPASARPYIGGSQTNSVLDLAFGYNGFGRITGDEVGSVGGGRGGNGGAWGETGWTRMFNAENGGQVSWLLPASLVLLAAGLLLAGRAARTDRSRAGFMLWGGWLLGTGITFSLMAGIFHAYYDVALAPAIGALVGMGVTALWRRGDKAAMVTLAAVLALTAIWSYVLLGRSAEFLSWLAPAVRIVGVGAAIALAASQFAPRRLPRLATAAVLAAGIGAGLAGPAAYAVETTSAAHIGAIPSAGPAVAGGRGFPGGGPPTVLGGGPAGGAGGPRLGNVPNPNDGRFPGGMPLGPGQVSPGGPGVNPQGGGPPGAGPRGGMGGLLNSTQPSAEVIAALSADADQYTWVAATIGSNNAAGYQLATGLPVMPIGGFNGSDPSPTLAQFQQYVAAGRIHYFVGGSGFNANGGSRTAQEIASWVGRTFSASTIGGVTFYDLTT